MQRQKSRKRTGGEVKSCVHHMPVNRSFSYSTMKNTSHQCALPLGNIRSPRVTRDHLNIKGSVQLLVKECEVLIEGYIVLVGC